MIGISNPENLFSDPQIMPFWGQYCGPSCVPADEIGSCGYLAIFQNKGVERLGLSSKHFLLALYWAIVERFGVARALGGDSISYLMCQAAMCYQDYSFPDGYFNCALGMKSARCFASGVYTRRAADYELFNAVFDELAKIAKNGLTREFGGTKLYNWTSADNAEIPFGGVYSFEQLRYNTSWNFLKCAFASTVDERQDFAWFGSSSSSENALKEIRELYNDIVHAVTVPNGACRPKTDNYKRLPDNAEVFGDFIKAANCKKTKNPFIPNPSASSKPQVGPRFNLFALAAAVLFVSSYKYQMFRRYPSTLKFKHAKMTASRDIVIRKGAGVMFKYCAPVVEISCSYRSDIRFFASADYICASVSGPAKIFVNILDHAPMCNDYSIALRGNYDCYRGGFWDYIYQYCWNRPDGIEIRNVCRAYEDCSVAQGVFCAVWPCYGASDFVCIEFDDFGEYPAPGVYSLFRDLIDHAYAIAFFHFYYTDLVAGIADTNGYLGKVAFCHSGSEMDVGWFGGDFKTAAKIFVENYLATDNAGLEFQRALNCYDPNGRYAPTNFPISCADAIKSVTPYSDESDYNNRNLGLVGWSSRAYSLRVLVTCQGEMIHGPDGGLIVEKYSPGLSGSGWHTTCVVTRSNSFPDLPDYGLWVEVLQANYEFTYNWAMASEYEGNTSAYWANKRIAWHTSDVRGQFGGFFGQVKWNFRAMQRSYYE